MNISVDLETYCELDLSSVGAYKYVNHPSFEILIMCYCEQGSPDIITLDLTVDREEAEEVYRNATSITAYNANFEKMCLEAYYGVRTDLIYHCTMVKSAYCGLPLALAQVSKALGLSESKDINGGALIRTFSIPVKPTVKNKQKTRNFPQDQPEKWRQFLAYCEQDVRVEMQISELLKDVKIPQAEIDMWNLDRKINEHGVYVDIEFIKKSIELDNHVRSVLLDRASTLTGVTNPNSSKQLMEWLNDTIGEDEEEVTSMKKADVSAMIKRFEGDDNVDIEAVLRIRQQLAKTSVKKYWAMLSTASRDRRIRGLFQYYGANRTGRWAGRLVQLQNLPRGMWDEYEIPQKVAEFKDSIKNTTPEAYLLEYPIETVQDILSSLIRSAIIAPRGKVLVVSDLSAIEARVLSWLAGETWRLEVFATHGKIYEASASKMFNIPMEEVTKSIRAKGKVAELALGYQGGAGALVQMGGLDMGLTLTELEGIKLLWRRNNPKIVALWKDLDEAVRTTLKSIDKVITVGVFKMRRFRVSPTLSFLQIKLPSGRSLFYANPFISQNKIGYYGLNDKKQWTKIDSYGGKFAENLTQAVARDVLAEGIRKADKMGFNISLHVHDEIGIEGDEADLPTLINLMSEPLSWAEGLPLGASGFVSSFYRK